MQQTEAEFLALTHTGGHYLHSTLFTRSSSLPTLNTLLSEIEQFQRAEKIPPQQGIRWVIVPPSPPPSSSASAEERSEIEEVIKQLADR